MILVKCPDVLFGLPEESITELSNILFLGGGISNCKDWQKEMVARFKDVEKLAILDPRRDNFDTSKPGESVFQIQWEFLHIHSSSAILFWFPYETLCPITLYELGVCAALGYKLFVGCHPAYARKLDVEVQLQCIRPDVKVRTNFADLVADVIEWHDNSNVEMSELLNG